MQLYSLTDESNLKHNFLVIQLSEKEFNELVGQCEKCIPSISISTLIHGGHPYIVVDFGSGSWKTVIPLDETLENNENLGDQLNPGDIVTVILTTNLQAVRVQNGKAEFDIPLDEILAFSFTYSKEMAENYMLYNSVSCQAS